jgi:hypothetical protein
MTHSRAVFWGPFDADSLTAPHLFQPRHGAHYCGGSTKPFKEPSRSYSRVTAPSMT